MNNKAMLEKEFHSLHRLWVRQLQKEFEEICYVRNVSLLLPVIEISLAKKQLGSWHAESGTIKISHFLICEHSWDITLNVLKHEMAHMICSEIFKDKNPGHNVAFQKACEILQLPEQFRKSASDLQEHISAQDPEERLNDAGRNMIDKIKKLLALAGSDNEHEASQAMQKACNLMTSYNIIQLNQDNRDGYIYLIIPTGSKQLAGYRRSLCTILRDHFHVQVICSTLYEPTKDESYKTIELLGRKENVAIAEHCYHFLENRLATLWLQNKNKWPGHKKTVRNSYYLGVLHGFRKKLLTQATSYTKEYSAEKNPLRIPPNTNINALLIREDKNLQDFVADRYPQLETVRRNSQKIYRNTYDEAVDTGKKINLHHAVCHKQKGNDTLLIN